jgi:RimJ/RimL family protein N-acetyltransferase
MILRDMKKEDEGLLNALNQRNEITKFIGPLVGLYKEPRAKVIETNKGTPAGIVAIIKSYAMDGKDLEILCALFSKHEGQGLATQACHKMLSEVLNDPSVIRLIGCVDRENTSSLALIKRLGGTFLQKRILIKGDQDIYVFQ